METPINNSSKLNIGEVQVRALPLSPVLANTGNWALLSASPHLPQMIALERDRESCQLGQGLATPPQALKQGLHKFMYSEDPRYSCEHTNNLLFMFHPILS